MRHEELREENCASPGRRRCSASDGCGRYCGNPSTGPRRFEEFQRRIGLARNVLADRLNLLVSEGILVRKPDATEGSRQEYRLTAKGHGLFPIYVAMIQWGNEWTGLPAPPVNLLHKPCGHRTTARVVCTECGAEITDHDTEPVVGRGLIMRHQ
jgi:DNA-binding HxlR family transcriptional regulator